MFYWASGNGFFSIQKAYINNVSWSSELNSFLRASRNAPQCSS